MGEGQGGVEEGEEDARGGDERGAELQARAPDALT